MKNNRHNFIVSLTFGILGAIEVISHLIYRYVISSPEETLIGAGGLIGGSLGYIINFLLGPIPGAILMMIIGLLSYSFPYWFFRASQEYKKLQKDKHGSF